MKSLIRNLFFLILISSGFSSCIYDNYPDEGDEWTYIDPDKTILQLDLKALNPSTMNTPTEKIKSVRVIIINKAPAGADTDGEQDGTANTPSSTVEYNRVVDFPALNASTFSYTLTWISEIGEKSVYVIANEESVSADLTTQLENYVETEDAGDLEQWLTDYAFSPQYNVTGNNIYLPYTFFKSDFTPEPAKLNAVNCWLIPVATKFVFHFENKRENAVRINGISMAYYNTSNYMMPRIDDEALYMEYGGESLYWTDWLATVSKSSWGSPESGDNEWFNQQYGWITYYYVPSPGDAGIYTFIEKDSKDAFTVDPAEEKVNDDGEEETVPGMHTTDIYYLPESINFNNPGSIGTGQDGDSGEPQQQTYYLTINFEDLGPGTAPRFEHVPIPNLNALFRNTFVVVQMVMGQGDIQIYAEIAPWNKTIAFGWVSEGNNPPSNNPFAIRKK